MCNSAAQLYAAMDTPYAAAVALIAVLTLLVIMAFIWYRFFGWKPFQFAAGDSPTWTPAGSADVSRLRFADAMFSVQLGDGTSRSQDVTAVLNGMAAAYSGGAANPTWLTLTRPLNAFSFVIPGFNDSATVPDPSRPAWCSSPPASCTGDSQCTSPVPGACSCSGPGGVCPPGETGTCYSCPGGAKVTLIGKWRTI